MDKKLNRERLSELAEESKQWPGYRHAELGAGAPDKWPVVRIPELLERIAVLEAELAEARRDGERYRYIRTESLIHWESGKRHNRISWPMIYAADPVDGGNYRDRFDAAIDAARGGAK